MGQDAILRQLLLLGLTPMLLSRQMLMLIGAGVRKNIGHQEWEASVAYAAMEG